MNIKELLKFDKIKRDFKKTGQFLASYWMKCYQVVFIVVFLLAGGIGLYLWYTSLYQSDWSEEKKREYSLTQSREINLKEEDFKKVLGDIENRKKIFESEHQPLKDIFKPYEGAKTE